MADLLQPPPVPEKLSTNQGYIMSPWLLWLTNLQKNITNKLEGGDVKGTANRIVVTDNGDGTVTIDVEESGIDHNSLDNLAVGNVHTQYQLLLVNSAGLRAALSDETGTGYAVFSTNPLFDVATGTNPFRVNSATLVSNLNADLIDGKHAGELGAMLGPPYLTVSVDLASATWNTVGTHEVATVTGDIEVVTAVGCSTPSPDAADNISYGIAGSTSFFIGATARNSISANEFWLTTTGSSAAAAVSIDGIAATSHLKRATIKNGTDIGYQIYTSAATQGKLDFYFWISKISSGADIVAGAGGSL